ncbi:hypothetical protein H5410_021517 [Solanum commersonii]|uniref:Uncharacterized protein n=1 Tax=Solanum commersonii TaxID=4109 RepID=A0A9J5ZFC7_SOLCO|nr:hypothetical protein H5410_021517 [Solanum commersonii]
MEKTHFHLGEDEILLSSSLLKNIPPNLRENIRKKYYSIYLLTSEISADGSLGEHIHVLDHRVVWYYLVELFGKALTAPFIASLILLLQDFAYWSKGRSASLRQIASYFCSFLHLSVHASTKTSNTLNLRVFISLAVQKGCFKQCYTRLNHECIQRDFKLLMRRFNCVLKDLSCDTPLPKIFMLTILATNASSS